MFLMPVFVVAGMLLGLAGLLKLRNPTPAAEALGLLRGPGQRIGVRALGAGEFALAGAAMASPSPLTAALVGGAYAGFATFLMTARRGTGEAESCGCFGEGSGGGGRLQVVLDLAAAAGCAGVAASGFRGWGWLVGQPPLQAVVLGAGVAGGALAAYLAYTDVPTAWHSYRAPAAP